MKERTKKNREIDRYIYEEKEIGLVLCVESVYMFDFMFTMPAKLSVCLPVAITVTLGNTIAYTYINMFAFMFYY